RDPSRDALLEQLAAIDRATHTQHTQPVSPLPIPPQPAVVRPPTPQSSSVQPPVQPPVQPLIQALPSPLRPAPPTTLFPTYLSN
ncbi:MAG: hypothetical protein HC857_04955, partial [Synechococcales cyanobacterium RU_4_20]|nr:hypothetical protein [Synechococcales cyanobacterium RU_4_20]